ncbi:hypothetical protein [Sphingobacterium puteale]|uniref:hypothetical protein n=1 Tax=Sphingobacterium puteale TaxID=2420510 RepID=UPI003D96A05E
MKRIGIFFIIVCLTSTNLFAQVKATLTILNYIKTDVLVFVESYDKNGILKANESFLVNKSTGAKEALTPTQKLYVAKGYKEGNIKIKYSPAESSSRFSLDPIAVPKNSSDFNQAVTLNGLTLHDVNDNKNRLITLGTELKFDSATQLSRIVDVKRQLGSLVVGKKEGEKLIISDIIHLKDVEIPYDKTSKLEETSVIEKSVMSQLKISVPIYGSVEAMMSNSDLNQVKWEILYYPFFNNTSFSDFIIAMDAPSKQSLINKLKINDSSLGVWLLREFDVIESGIFSVTNGTKINTDGNAAIASVFTASAAYAFKSENSKFVSIPNKAYNLKYTEWQKVGTLIQFLQSKILNLPIDGNLIPNRLTPQNLQ